MIIRLATAQDLKQINDIYNYYINNTVITFDTIPWSLSQRQEWHQRLIVTERYQLFVACDGDSIIGFAYNGQYRPKAAYQDSTEVTIYTRPDNSLKGIGRALYQKLIQHLRQQDFHRAYALITIPNQRSLILHQKFGFKQVGLMSEVGHKFNQHHDVALLEMRL